MKLTDIDIEHATILTHAIQTSFQRGADEWQLEAQLSRGMSGASIYRFSIDQDSYIAKINKLNDPHANIPCEFQAMNIASKNKTGPTVYFTDENTGIAIMDYVEPVRYTLAEMSNDANIAKLAELVRTLHEGEAMSARESVCDRIDYVRSLLPKKVLESEIFSRALEHQALLRETAFDVDDMRPCHTDIHPFNLLNNGEKFSLIDWGAATQASFYFDLALIGIYFYYDSDDSERRFLESYFQAEPTEAEFEKFNQMKIIAYVYGGLMLMLGSLVLEAPLIGDEEIAVLPNFSAFMAMIGTEEIDLADTSSQQKMSYILLNRSNITYELMDSPANGETLAQ